MASSDLFLSPSALSAPSSFSLEAEPHQRARLLHTPPLRLSGLSRISELASLSPLLLSRLSRISELASLSPLLLLWLSRIGELASYPPPFSWLSRIGELASFPPFSWLSRMSVLASFSLLTRIASNGDDRSMASAKAGDNRWTAEKTLSAKAKKQRRARERKNGTV